MPDFSLILPLLPMPVLLVMSAIFSGSETALFSLPTATRVALRHPKTLVERSLMELLSDTRHLLITLLLGNMVVNVLFIVLATVASLGMARAQVSGWVTAGLNVGSLLALILVGEVLPKQVAHRWPVRWARAMGVGLWVLHRAIGPVRGGLDLFVITPLARLIQPMRATPGLTREELETLLRQSASRGVIDEQEQVMLRQVLALGSMRVRELMTPRVDVVAYDLDDEPGVLDALSRRVGVSELPVYHRDLDDIVGLLNVRDLLRRRPGTQAEIRELVRPVMFVPQAQRADQLLEALRSKGATMAVVVDEYGGTAGVVTLEDLVEQVVGDLAEPGELTQPLEVESVGPSTWRVSASLSVSDWAQAFDAKAQRGSSAVNTVGGLVMARLGRLPKVGDCVTLGNLELTVASMRGRRLGELTLRLRDGGVP